MIKLNLMEKHNKIFLKHNIIINSYLTFFLPIVIKKIFKINFFLMSFMFKFFFFKLLKLIFSLIVYNKLINILIYYYVNLKLIIKNISNFFFLKYLCIII